MLVLILLGLGIVAVFAMTALLPFPWVWIWLPILIFAPSAAFNGITAGGIEGSGGAVIILGGLIGALQMPIY